VRRNLHFQGGGSFFKKECLIPSVIAHYYQLDGRFWTSNNFLKENLGGSLYIHTCMHGFCFTVCKWASLYNLSRGRVHHMLYGVFGN